MVMIILPSPAVSGYVFPPVQKPLSRPSASSFFSCTTNFDFNFDASATAKTENIIYFGLHKQCNKIKKPMREARGARGGIKYMALE